MLRRSVAAAIALVGALGTGCASVSHVQTADTLGEGRFQFAFEPGVGGAALVGGSESGVVSAYYPHVDMSLRYGVTDQVDLGVRLGSSLAELQSKFLLTQPSDPLKAISLAPSVSGAFFGASSDEVAWSYLNVSVPVLLGFKSRGGSELVLGPRVMWTRLAGEVADENAAINIISLGASVGYAIRVTEGFRLMPEVAYSMPVIGEVSARRSNSEALSGFAGGIAQFKLGFLFGAGRPIRRGPDT